jgi:hypothetical protein
LQTDDILPKKDDITLIKRHDFNDYKHCGDVNCYFINREVEVRSHDDCRQCQQALQGDDEEEGLHPLSVSFTIEEHAVDQGVESHLQQEIDFGECPEDKNQVIGRRKYVVIAMDGEGVEVAERGKEQTSEDDDEQLEALLAAGLGHNGHALMGGGEEVLDLTGEEATNAGIGDDGQQEGAQQEQRDDIVATHAVGHGVARGAEAPTLQFRVKEGVSREESLLIV